MPLSGELTDLSLAELIEFFCNQRKTGCIEIVCEDGEGNFYLQSGSLVHASIGSITGIEAVHYALTLSKASFTFKPSLEAPQQTINQPWTSVVLEGLRLMDEGVKFENPFPNMNGRKPKAKAVKKVAAADREPSIDEDGLNIPAEEEPMKLPSTQPSMASAPKVPLGTYLSETESPFAYGPRKLAWIFAAVILIVAVVAVPWGWYARNRAARVVADSKAANESPTSINDPTPLPQVSDASASQPSPSPVSKEVTVQVIYDESGRVTDAFGADAAALKLARQKRFPAGKAGTATITVPSN
jgi:hypothetical protein